MPAVSFTGKQNNNVKPLAIMCDLFERKKDATDIVEVKNWQNTTNHGFYTSSVAQATCPEVEVRAFDIGMFNGEGKERYLSRARQIADVMYRAIEIKKANPDRPISINLSLGLDGGLDLQEVKKSAQGRDLSECKKELQQKFLAGKEECDIVFKAMKEFLSLKDTKIYIAAGNEPGNLSTFLLCDAERLYGVHGTNARGVDVPFFETDDLSKKAGQSLFNVYKKDGQAFIIVKDRPVELPANYQSEQLLRNNIKERLETILGSDLRGRPYNEVKNHLMLVDDLIKNIGESYKKLNEEQKAYLDSKKGFYIPVGWGIDDLKSVHLSDNGLFFGVDSGGRVYWSPDGSEPRPELNAPVIGCLKGTSFAAPSAMMNDFARMLVASKGISFTGSIKMSSFKPQQISHYVAYSKTAGL